MRFLDKMFSAKTFTKVTGQIERIGPVLHNGAGLEQNGYAIRLANQPKPYVLFSVGSEAYPGLHHLNIALAQPGDTVAFEVDESNFGKVSSFRV